MDQAKYLTNAELDRMGFDAMLEQYVLPSELNAVLGPRWAICANTERNRERYGYCITKQAYQRARITALYWRETPNTSPTQRMHVLAFRKSDRATDESFWRQRHPEIRRVAVECA